MKTTLLALITFALFVACKKEDLNKDIALYDKPLKTLKKYTTGKFEIKYAKGGLIGGTYPITGRQIFDIGNDHIIWTINDTVFADSPIEWVPVKDLSNRSTFSMQFKDTRGYPYGYVPESVTDGLLVLSENTPDGLAYFCKRLS